MDPSWCPGCDRLILPKRFLVPITTPASDNQPSQQQSPPPPPPPPASTPVPSSPQVRKKHTDQPRRLGLGGGLLQGTGRIRPGAPLKSTANSPNGSTKASNPARRPQPRPQQRKSRVVISQDPTPLYCSEECRLRDLKNSFIESESAGFAGAPAALKHIAKLEHIEQLEKRIQSQKKLTRRHSSNATPTVSQSAVDLVTNPTPSDPSTSSAPCPPPQTSGDAASASKSKPIFRTSSYSSTSTASTSTKKDGTVRPTPRRNSSTSVLLSRMPSWGSPTKSALAPPATNLFHARSSSCSYSPSSTTDTSLSMSLSMSSLFESSLTHPHTGQSVDTEGTTPSGSGGSGSDEKRKGKRVSFASDSKPLVESPVEEEEEKIPSTSTSATQVAARAGSSSNTAIHTTTTTTSTSSDGNHGKTEVIDDWRSLSRTRRRNPLQDAHPLLEALSLSPKDRRARPSSLPTVTESAAATTSANPTRPTPPPLTVSHSTPAIVANTSNLRRSATASSTIYKIAMWPEDEKRTTESAQVHGQLLRGYAKRFGPREGRSLVWSPLWVSADRASSSSSSSTSPQRPAYPTSPISLTWSPTTSAVTTPDQEHEAHDDSDRTYWTQWESQQAALRARRKAESQVARLEEEGVISELLDGAGMREEDQPQARRMRRMAYDGMPGPAELRGLTYSFDKFLYDLGELTAQGSVSGDDGTQVLGEDGLPVPAQEKKRLFNFEDD